MGEAQRRRQEYREGRQRLVAWLSEVEDSDDMVEPLSGLAKATFNAMTMDNLDAILIYQAPKGGWHCDLVLKDMPPGVPNSFGTRVETPCKTREEAEEVGRGLLAATIIHIKARQKPEKPTPVFLLHGAEFKLLPEIFEITRQMMPDMLSDGGPYKTAIGAIHRIESVLEQLFPNGFDPDAFNNMDRDRQIVLLSVLHGATLAGVFRYPLRKDGVPV